MLRCLLRAPQHFLEILGQPRQDFAHHQFKELWSQSTPDLHLRVVEHITMATSAPKGFPKIIQQKLIRSAKSKNTPLWLMAENTKRKAQQKRWTEDGTYFPVGQKQVHLCVYHGSIASLSENSWRLTRLQAYLYRHIQPHAASTRQMG